jgi:PAS domain S-box-containing protein
MEHPLSDSKRHVSVRAERIGRDVVIAFVVFGLVVIPLLTAGSLTSLRAQVIADAENQTSNLARAFASHASGAVNEIAGDVNGIAMLLGEDSLTGEPNEYRLHQLLRSHLLRSRHIAGAAILDANGTMIANGRHYPAPKIDFSDRDYFSYHRQSRSTELLLGKPTISRTDHRLLVPLTRRLIGEDGKFLGIIATSMAPDYFAQFYRTVSLGSGSIVELIDSTGTVLAQAGTGAAGVGSPSELWRGYLTKRDPGPTFRMRVSSDETERIVSVHGSEQHPISAQVAVSLDDVLAAWRPQLYQQSAAAALAMLGLLGFGISMNRQYSRLAESQALERRHAEVLHNTILSMGDAVIVADEAGKILIANPAAERLYGQREQMGTPEWEQHYHRLYPDGVTPLPYRESAFGRVLRGQQVDNLPLAMRREGESSCRHLIANGRPLLDAAGGLRGAVLVYRDVTDAREIERQLRHSQKMDAIGQLTGGVAHDFNNILTVITGTIEILTEAVQEKPSLHRIAKMIDEAAERGAALTSHLLAFARRQPLEPRDTDINQLMVEIQNLLNPTIGGQIEIETMLEPDTWPALIDRGLLTTAIVNLALNARDAMPNGGCLLLQAGNVYLDETYVRFHSETSPGPYVMITVRDTGTGIPAEIRDKVFEPFFTTKAVGKGTGLGLAMVYGFVKQSGGHVALESEQGQGTTINIYLPRSHQAAEPANRSSAAAVAQGGREQILVVEDDPLVRTFIMAQLTALGYRAVSAANGPEALRLIEEGLELDLLLTDVVMPGSLNGRQLAAEVVRRRGPTRILFTSGYAENAVMHHGRLDPDVLLLAKPYRKADLARMVRTALERPAAPQQAA